MKIRTPFLKPFHINRRTGTEKGLRMVKKKRTRRAKSGAAREKKTMSFGILLRPKYEARAPTAHLRRCVCQNGGTYDSPIPLMKCKGSRRRRWWQYMRCPAFAYGEWQTPAGTLFGIADILADMQDVPPTRSRLTRDHFRTFQCLLGHITFRYTLKAS